MVEIKTAAAEKKAIEQPIEQAAVKASNEKPFAEQTSAKPASFWIMYLGGVLVSMGISRVSEVQIVSQLVIPILVAGAACLAFAFKISKHRLVSACAITLSCAIFTLVLARLYRLQLMDSLARPALISGFCCIVVSIASRPNSVRSERPPSKT